MTNKFESPEQNSRSNREVWREGAIFFVGAVGQTEIPRTVPHTRGGRSKLETIETNDGVRGGDARPAGEGFERAS
jgi:hypothetical protein